MHFELNRVLPLADAEATDMHWKSPCITYLSTIESHNLFPDTPTCTQLIGKSGEGRRGFLMTKNYYVLLPGLLAHL